jgi:hypothetical protein
VGKLGRGKKPDSGAVRRAAALRAVEELIETVLAEGPRNSALQGYMVLRDIRVILTDPARSDTEALAEGALVFRELRPPRGFGEWYIHRDDEAERIALNARFSAVEDLLALALESS